MDYFKKYDETDPNSIEEYAQQLIGCTFRELIHSDDASLVREDNIANSYENKSRKGGLGNLLEEEFFGYKANSVSEADFAEAGVELKVTPFERNKSGDYRAGERLVLGMISYDSPIDEVLENSHIWRKCKLLLIIYYLRNKKVLSNLDYEICFANLFTPPAEDLRIIENDYRIIAEKIKSGKAHELSESDTMYLGACTKGVNAEKSTVPQFYGDHILARKRAFCYKVSYMTYVLNNYIVPGVKTYSGTKKPQKDIDLRGYESIIKSIQELKSNTFEQVVEKRINRWVGKTDKELCSLFDREYNNNKTQWIDLSYRMLEIKSNRAEEFVKANISVKAIRIEENGKMKENSPLPPFKFLELVEEKWEESELFSYFDETRFLFVVFKKRGSEYVLKGCQMWNMPYSDLNKKVYEGWDAIRRTLKDGVVLKRKGKVIENNFPKKKDNEIIHIRPHASKSYYVFEDGSTFGSGSISDSDILPDGRRMTKQSFWLNNDYIISQLRDGLKE